MRPVHLSESRELRPGSIPVFVLCGGKGTRLARVDARPKAVIPVAGLPFLTYTLRLLRLQGFEQVHLLLGHGAEEVRRRFEGAGVTCWEEGEPMGTGGALARVRAAAADTNLILNGDSYAEALYPQLIAAHAARGQAADDGVTILAVPADDRRDYGGLEIGPDGGVTAFVEKGGHGPGWINAGVYAAGGRFFRDLPDGGFSLETEVLPTLADRGILWAFGQRFFFRDIGTPERLRLAQEEFRWIRNRMEEPA